MGNKTQMLQNFCSNRATNYKLRTKTVWREVHFCLSRPVDKDLPWTRINTAYYYFLFFIFLKKSLGAGGYLIPGPEQAIGLQEDLH